MSVALTAVDERGVALVLGARRDQLPLFASARRRGLQVAAADPDPDAPGLALADAALVADLADDVRVGAWARSMDVRAVLTYAADYPVPLVSRLADQLGLPGLAPRAVAACTDKLAMRQSFAGTDLRMPAWIHAVTEDDAVDAAGRLGGDVVIKPRRASGSRGVTGVRSEATEAVRHAARRALAIGGPPGVLVEAHVAGDEVSVEAVAVGGRVDIVAHTDKVTTEAPHFVEIGHAQPSAQPAHRIEQLDQAVCRAVGALGIDRAMVHAEFRIDDVGPVLVEIAARAAGGAIASDLVRLTTGVDTADLALALALGETVTPRCEALGGACVRYLTPPAGQVATVQGAAAAAASVGVERLDLWLDVGDVVHDLEDARQRVGRVITTGPDTATAVARAIAAASLIEVGLR